MEKMIQNKARDSMKGQEKFSGRISPLCGAAAAFAFSAPMLSPDFLFTIETLKVH
jgi:hypothetical protein